MTTCRWNAASKALVVLGLGLALGLAAVPMAHAQAATKDAKHEGGILEEIVVTAQKREQNLQDVALAVSAFSGEQLKSLGITQTTDITQQIPALHLNDWSPNVTIFNLRGISQNNFVDSNEAPVAVYMDGAYMASLNGISGQLYDTQRVEVLRGPQGTLFGRNATGGLIHYVSNDASNPEHNGYASITNGSYNRFALEVAEGGSISDSVRFRVAARYSAADGYVKSTDTVLPHHTFKGSGEDLGGEDGWGARANLQVDFTSALKGSFWIKHSEDNDVPTGGYVFANCVYNDNGFCHVDNAGLADGSNGVINGITGAPASPYQNFGETRGHFNRKTDIGQADFNYDLGNGVKLTSITNYTKLKKDYLEDGDALPVFVINFANAVDFKQFSEELRLAGTSGKLTWQTGLYYLDFDIDGSVTTFGAPVIGSALALGFPGIDPIALQTYDLKSKNYSLFGQTEYEIVPKVTLVTGFRWSQDKKSIDYKSVIKEGNLSATKASSASYEADIPGVTSISRGDWAARLGLNYKPNDDTLLFASYDRGIKGGGWSLNPAIGADQFKYLPETLHSFSAGAKLTLLDKRMHFNTTLFHYVYKNYQAFSVQGGTPQIANSDATATGGEVELGWSPNRHFDSLFGMTFEHSSVDAVPGPGQQYGPDFTGGAFANGTTINNCTYQSAVGAWFCNYPNKFVRNAELPNAPHTSFNYLLRYNFDALAGNIALQADGAWYGDQFLEVTNSIASTQKAYNLTNASLTWKGEASGLEVEGYVKNAFDKAYAVYSLNLGILGPTQFYGMPRTFGISVRKSW
jgi:iron complex outermembrane receptor protein